MIFAIVKIKKDEQKKENTTNEPKQEEVQEVKELKLGVASFDSINPILSKNKNVQDVSKIIFEPLMTLTKDYKLEACLAKEWAKQNETVYLIKLRDDKKWSDGQKFTADDVKFTIELMLKTPGTNAVASEAMSCITGAQDYKDGKTDDLAGVTVDGNDVTVNFDKVSANALQVFSQWPILPEHCLKDADPNTLQQNEFWQHPIGSGPFMVDEVVLNNYCTLKRWDGYWKKGTGNIETIYEFASGENDSNLVKNASAGKIDYAWSKSTDDAKAIEALDNMKVEQANIRYTRCFYINQFPHEPNIK